MTAPARLTLTLHRECDDMDCAVHYPAWAQFPGMEKPHTIRVEVAYDAHEPEGGWNWEDGWHPKPSPELDVLSARDLALGCDVTLTEAEEESLYELAAAELKRLAEPSERD